MHTSFPLFKASSSSKQWLARHFQDPYVKRRMLDNPAFRSRSAYKLLEMDDKFHFLQGFQYHKNPVKNRPNIIIDLGAAPGGWSQVVAFKTGHPIVSMTKSNHPVERSFGLKEKVKGPRDDSWSDGVVAQVEDEASSSDEDSQADLPTIIALDLHRMDRINGVISLQADFLSPVAEVLIQGNFPDQYKLQSVDLLLSDMAANKTGNPTADGASSIHIATSVFQFACRHLTLRSAKSSGGVMV
ncbi:hypothetical protein Clacol_008530 [Clathrus columnatus]|uniref:rRNA methyltransferase 2, mitochondrial n=1 Tax=Clathrus columnatus TaxID=1419009 RepID=A0AAV5AHZ8_9AGAM|nr:hypothetical protein Clacol_008530 [Clathrus columnatus]